MTTLYYREGTSDKVYSANLAEVDGGWDVTFAYGRRGSTMNTGKKNASPLSKEQAEKALDKLLREKLAKGYTPGEEGGAYVSTSQEDRYTGILPMLLNAVGEEETRTLLMDEEWATQKKHDGVRMMISKTIAGIFAINRKGLVTGAPEAIIKAVAKLPGEFILDGECVGEEYFAFDLIDSGDFSLRFFKLKKLLKDAQAPIFLVETAFTEDNKGRMFNKLILENAEGIVFKLSSAHYTPGRTGNALKFKFKARDTFIVAGCNATRRSVSLYSIKNGGDYVPVGNVTIPPNCEIPKHGDLVEVEYLYAYRGGSLFQPVYKGVRNDSDGADDYNSLKFKEE